MITLVDSVGIEIEFANVQKDTARDIANRVGWRLVEDGSCRTYRYTLGKLETTSSDEEAVMFGGELIYLKY